VQVAAIEVIRRAADYPIDVLTESFFPKYISLVEKELDVTAQRVQEAHTEILDSVEKISRVAKRLRPPDKIRSVMPKGFPRIRSFGWLANRRRSKLLPLCRLLLPNLTEQNTATLLTQPALWRCPRCHGPMSGLERLTAAQLLETEGRQECITDTS
jgi:hypothetical protein